MNGQGVETRMSSNMSVKILITSIVFIVLLSGSLQITTTSDSPHNIGGVSQSSGHFIPVRGIGSNQAGQQVNVNNLYAAEPAPMGIADYGIGSGGSPYSYSTTSFLGNINIKNLLAYNASLNRTATQLTFQLNINFVFHVGSNEYVYWVQNVADFNTSTTPSIGFVDNVWNETGTNSSVYNSTLSGNGTVGNSSGTLYYYAFANQGLPGNDIYVSYPISVLMAINSTTTSGGIPELLFLYNDGRGWQTYDNVLFNFATSVTKNDGFVVDGYVYEPDGYSFYDAELILGGPGGGTKTNDINSSVSLQLDYYNGHNYQMVTNAYNFGSDTAEGISNVTSTARHYNSNGSLFASVQNGTGQLALLYNREQIGILNVTAGVSSGYVVVNSTRYNFVGGGANLTIAPGTYHVGVYSSNGTLVVQRNETLSAGGYLTLATSSSYRVTFLRSGLPSGAKWYLNISNGESINSTNSSAYEDLTNGSYTFSASSGGTYYSNGSFNVSGTNETVNVVFETSLPTTYRIAFQETGLTAGKTWSVTLNGSTESSSSSSILFNETNGTYNYTVGRVRGYTFSPGSGHANVSGVVTVDGKSLTVNVSFVEVLYNVTFIETGLPAGSNWSVGMENRVLSSKTDSITFEAPNGTYSFTAFTVNSYVAHPTNGNLTVNGSSVSELIKYSPFGKFTYLLFNETGLPNGTGWSVIVSFGNTIHNQTLAFSDGATAEYVILNKGANSTYWFRVTALFGYVATPSEGNVTTNGMANYTVNIAFSRVDYLSGTISPTDASLFIDGQQIATTNGTYNVTLKIGQTYRTEVTSPGYETSYGNVTVTNSTPIVTAYSISLVKVSKPVSLELVVIISVIIVAIIAAAVVAMVTRNRVKRS